MPGSGGRLSVGGYLDSLAVVRAEASRRQRPGALLALGLDARPARWLRGRLEIRGRAGGPFEGGHPGEYSLVHTFQNHTPSVELSEAYVDVLSSRADLRVGIQKLAWGKLDGTPPTDVVNPRDFHDPLVEDFEERKIGIPAVLGTYYLPDVPRLALAGLRVSLAYLPIATASRLPLLEERWFPSSITAVSSVTVPPSVLPLDPPLVVPVAFRTENHRPPKTLGAGGIAFRLGGSWREVDWDVYHYTGPETGPNVDLISTAYLVSPLPDLRVRSVAELRQATTDIHMTGADVAAALFGVTVRAEMAVLHDRPYLRPGADLLSGALTERTVDKILRQLASRGRAPVPLGPLFDERDSIEWGIGADYLIHGFVPLLQLNQIAFLDDGPRLLVSDPDTRLSASLKKRFLGDRLELEVRGTYAIEREAWFVFPRVSYQVRDDIRVRVGYLGIGGPTESVIGQYRDNDEFVFQGRYSF